MRSDIVRIREKLRAESLAARDSLPPSVRADKSGRIIDHLWDYLVGKEVLHTYVSFRSEVDTHSLIEEALESGLRVVVPIIKERDGSKTMLHSVVTTDSAYHRGLFGVEEPIHGIPVDLHTLDIVIVPLAAFDRKGTRLGYGKGFYDRFLSALPRTIPRIGLAFAIQETAEIPQLTHDEPLNLVITEDEVIYCGSS